jgi:hypothetical protein
MSEKFNSTHPYLVERSSGAIDVMQPTGRQLERHGVDEQGNPTVTRRYELRGQMVEQDAEGNVGYPTKFVHENALTLDAQAGLAETLHEGLDVATVRHLGASATHELVEVVHDASLPSELTEEAADEANEYDGWFDTSSDLAGSVEDAAVRTEESPEEKLMRERRNDDQRAWNANIQDYENGKQ